MNTPQKPDAKIGSGRNITKVSEQIYKHGSLMFIEGESSTEMFIIRSGKIRILKQEGDNTIELAVLGAGSVLGELSLLDHQPRSATAQVIEDVRATIIDEIMFTRTMKSIPGWLANIIQVVVKRLRDTMKKTSDSIVQKSVAGVIKILLLLYNHEPEVNEETSQKSLLLTRVKDVVSSTIGIGEMETENVFLHLILKEMLLIKKDDVGKEHIFLNDYNVLQLYMNYLRSSQRNMKMTGENLPDTASSLIQTILDAGDKNGRIVKPGIKKIGMPQVEIELQRQGLGKHIDLDTLDSLLDAKVIFKEQDTTKTSHQTHKRIVLIYSEKNLKNILTLLVWLPTFKEDVIF